MRNKMMAGGIWIENRSKKKKIGTFSGKYLKVLKIDPTANGYSSTLRQLITSLGMQDISSRLESKIDTKVHAASFICVHLLILESDFVP